MLGPAAGGAAYGPALTDLVVLGPAGRVFVTGPDVVRRVTGEDVDAERLGGAGTQTRSGVVHLAEWTDAAAVRRVRELVVLLGAPWPGAQVDVMGASAAIEVLHRRELTVETDPVRRAELVLRLVAQHEATTGGLTRAVECGDVDEVLEPVDTRRRLVEALAGRPDQRRGNRANPPL